MGSLVALVVVMLLFHDAGDVVAADVVLAGDADADRGRHHDVGLAVSVLAGFLVVLPSCRPAVQLPDGEARAKRGST
jgi:hypothetical protein